MTMTSHHNATGMSLAPWYPALTHAAGAWPAPTTVTTAPRAHVIVYRRPDVSGATITFYVYAAIERSGGPWEVHYTYVYDDGRSGRRTTLPAAMMILPTPYATVALAEAAADDAAQSVASGDPARLRATDDRLLDEAFAWDGQLTTLTETEI